MIRALVASLWLVLVSIVPAAATAIVTEYQVAPTVTISAGEPVNFYARCTEGVRIGGGYQFEIRPPHSQHLAVTANMPSAPNDWRIDVTNYSVRDVTVRLGVHIICRVEDE